MDKETPKYWMSLEQWRNDPKFKELAESEFLSSPFAPDDANSGWARREFLKLMGASLALTSFGCVRQAQKIVPYAKRPEDIIPGIANHYASTVFDGNEVFGAVVTTREGRPIKLEGNKLHPSNKGAMSARAHSLIMSLYDPDRLTEAKINLLNEKKTNRDTVGASWEKFDEKVVAALKEGKVAMLSGSINSPSTEALVKTFNSNWSIQHYKWEPLNLQSLKTAQKKSYGNEVVPHLRLDKSNYTVSLGADLLGTYMSPTESMRQFSSRRDPNMQMSKLVVFEPTLSLTGSNADQRFRVKATQLVDVAMGLAFQIVVSMKKSSFANSAAVRESLQAFSDVPGKLGISSSEFESVAQALWENRAQSLVVAGGLPTETENAVEMHVAVNFLNSVLENDGKTLDYSLAEYKSFQGKDSELIELTKAINEGKVQSLIIYDVNPVYAAPAQLKFAEALRKLQNVIYVGTHMDETAQMANLIASDHHLLENWGDGRVQDGVLCLQQPAIQPLGNTRSFQDSLLSWASLGGRNNGIQNSDWYDFLENSWKYVHSRSRNIGIGKLEFDEFWFRMKQEGVFVTNSKLNENSSGRNFNTSELSRIKPTDKSGLEFVTYSTSGLKDGTLSNVSWLHEFSDPVTRISWDNYLCVSPKMADRDHLKEGQVVEIKVNGLKRKVPVHIQPGQHDEVVALAVGYGRAAAGKVGNGIGVAAFDLARVSGDRVLHSGHEVAISKTSEMIRLANVQGHHSMEGRQIVVEATLDKYKKSPDKVVHRHKVFSAWPKHKYSGHKWAMSVDLNACTGCGTCTIACQSENNVPTVGKKYMLEGREMTWIRIDRYYVGNPENPDTVYQPVACLHCDNAPCETVCPVAATTHSDEGTNDMIYNRCVGTRYCANNCPYKVRRFNWFSYTTIESPLHMALNPEVTVRHRGVMEKCTFCTHRIKDAKRNAIANAQEFKASSVTTACQDSCPTNAIVFGDMNDAESEVSQAFKDVRTYSLLEELNTVPALRYKYKVRNTDQLKGGDPHGHDSHDKGGHA